jgi:hypothetical protein
VSILEKDSGQEVFRWRAAAGTWSIYLNDVMPRDSPCGTAIDRNAAILMSYSERHFPYARSDMPPITEALLIPFQLRGYGALSNSVGVVKIQWRILPNPSRIFAMNWRERNGPLVEVPQRQGFGHTMVVRTVQHAFDASVVLNYAPTGVQWEFSASAAAVLTGRPP